MNRKQVFSASGNERGNAMLFALFIAFIAAGFLAANIDSLTVSKKQSIATRILETRAALKSKLKLYCTLPATFRTSLTKDSSANSALANCVLGQSAACASGESQPVTLYTPIYDTASSSSIQMVAGPSSGANPSPARFDAYGNPCIATSATAECPFSITASMTATCAAGAPSCSRAATVGVTYSFSSLATGAISGGNAGDSASATIETIVCPQVNTTDILPLLAGTAGKFASVQTFSLTAATTSIATSTADVIAALDSAGVTNANLRSVILDIANSGGPQRAVLGLKAVMSIEPADTSIQTAIASAWVTDPVQAQTIAAAISGAGITNYSIQLGLAGMKSVGVGDSSTAMAIANAISEANITDNLQQIALSHAGITSPAIAIALSSTGMTWGHNNQYAESIASQLTAAGPMAQTALNELAVSLLIQTMANTPIASVAGVSDLSAVKVDDVTIASDPTSNSQTPIAPATLSLINTCTKKTCSTTAF